MVVPAEIRRQLEEHGRAEAPNEACGLIAFRNGVAERYLPGTNLAESPYRFDFAPRDPMEVVDLEDQGFVLAVFHTHPNDKAKPSRTDLAKIGLWERQPYFILAMRTSELRGWRIEDGRVDELELAE